jgi:cytosine/adenosine deaminase-related metal-dependent hydrolase
VLLLMIALVASAAAQQTANSVVIRAGRLLDVKSGKMLVNQTIVIEGERIVSVSGAAPASAKVIDLPNATVLPGMASPRTPTAPKAFAGPARRAWIPSSTAPTSMKPESPP